MCKQKLSIVSLSGGKDSTAMYLGMIERGMPIDCVLFCDTGLEFPAMYDHLARLEKETGRRITRIKAEHSYEYLMFDAPVRRGRDSPIVKKYGAGIHGFGWPGPRQRWCTSRLKDKPREKFLRELREQYTIMEYIGIAADEQHRLERARNQCPNHVHPLVDWGMTEADCLQYCYEHGYDWDGLYRHFSRVSCWCCPLQSLDESRQLYRHFPELWEQLKAWDKRTWRKFRADYSIEELEKRFDLEEEWQKAGDPLGTRAFFAALKERLERWKYHIQDTDPLPSRFPKIKT